MTLDLMNNVLLSLNRSVPTRLNLVPFSSVPSFRKSSWMCFPGGERAEPLKKTWPFLRKEPRPTQKKFMTHGRMCWIEDATPIPEIGA